MPKKIDLTGRRFGRLVVLEEEYILRRVNLGGGYICQEFEIDYLLPMC